MVITAAVEPGENLLGYVLRISNANGIAGNRILLARIRQTPTILTRATDLRPLSKLTGQPVEALKRASYVVDSDPNQVSIGAHALQTFWMNIERSRVCPGCLRERIITPKLWDLKTYVACHKHGVLLIDRCPSCQRFINWLRPGVDRCSCGQEYSSAGLTDASDGQLAVSQAQVDVMVGSECEVSPTNHFPTLVSMAWHFGRQMSAKAAPPSTMGKPPLLEAAIIIENSSKVILNWPEGLHDWLKREEREGIEHDGIAASFGSTLNTLRRHYGHAEGQFIIDEVREYLARQWKGGRVRAHSIFHLEVEQPKFLTVGEIAEKAGVATPTVVRAIHDGVIEATAKGASGRTFLLIKPEAAEKYYATLKDALERSAVADLLGVHLRAVEKLRKASIITSNNCRGLIQKSDLLALMQRLEALAVSTPPVDGIPLSYPGSLGGSLPDLLGAVLAGRITLFRTSPEKDGLRKFSLEKAEVREKTRGFLLSLNEASRVLGVRLQSLRAFTKAGLIRVAGQIHGRPLYDRKDLSEFRREYRLSRDIAVILGTSPSWASLKMRSLGIGSLAPSEDRCVSGVWRTTDVPDFGSDRHLNYASGTPVNADPLAPAND